MSAHSFDNLKVDLLKSLDFFRTLDSEVIESLAHNCEEILLNPEEILFEEGELGDAMYLILYGSLSIERQNTVIAKRGRGEYVGEMSLIESAPRAATVKTHTKTHLLKILKEQFHNHFTSNRQTLLEILKTISERYREDLAALEQSMKSLQEEKKVSSHLQEILNNTSNEIYTLDPTTLQFLHMNPSALRNLEYQQIGRAHV